MTHRTTYHPHPMSEMLDDTLTRLVREHALAVESLTEEQFVAALKQALPDFQKLVSAQGQMVVYLPGSEADRWRRKYYDLLEQSEKP